MLSCAMILVAKVRRADGGDLYEISMEAAAIIRKAVRDLMVSNQSCLLSAPLLVFSADTIKSIYIFAKKIIDVRKQ